MTTTTSINSNFDYYKYNYQNEYIILSAKQALFNYNSNAILRLIQI